MTRTLGAVLLVVVLAAVAAVADAAVRRLSFEELTRRSQWIVTGTVTAMRSSEAEWPGVGTCLVTDVTIRVSTRLKGPPLPTTSDPVTSTTPQPEVRHEEIEVRILGGSLDGTWQHCPEAPRFRETEEVLVFVREHRGRLWNTGWQQGKYTIVPDREGSRVVRGRPLFPIAANVPLSRVRGQIELFSRTDNSVRASGGER